MELIAERYDSSLSPDTTDPSLDGFMQEVQIYYENNSISAVVVEAVLNCHCCQPNIGK